MIELYQFIHPFCPSCLAAEQHILRLSQHDSKKILFKFVPYLNFQFIGGASSVHEFPNMNLSERSTFYSHAYQAALDYKAMLLQGKKMGRAFLFALQDAVGNHQHVYSADLVDQLVQQVHGDLAMFHADRRSSYVQQAFLADQHTAQEMHVTKSGSLVVFNYAAGQDYGILIEEELPFELLDTLLQAQPLKLVSATKKKTITGHSLTKEKESRFRLLDQ